MVSNLVVKIKSFIKSKNKYNNPLDALGYVMSEYMYSGKLPNIGDLGEFDIYFKNICGICDDLKKNGLESYDFLNPHNIGLKNGRMVYFDIGYSMDQEFDMDSAINLYEGESPKNLIPIANKIFDFWGITNPKLIGSGMNGLAFRNGDRVYKITTDLSEGNNAKKLVGKNCEYLVNYHRVSAFNVNQNKVFYIEMEYLKTNPNKIGKLYNKINDLIETRLIEQAKKQQGMNETKKVIKNTLREMFIEKNEGKSKIYNDLTNLKQELELSDLEFAEAIQNGCVRKEFDIANQYFLLVKQSNGNKLVSANDPKLLNEY